MRIRDQTRAKIGSNDGLTPAELWFSSYIWGRRGVTCEEFIVDVCALFRDDLRGKVVEEFNRLQYTGSLDKYLAKFEELKSLLLVQNPNMLETYILESFITGLKPAIKPLVRAFKPHTLDLAIEQARFQEEHMQALKISPDRTFRSNLPPSNSRPLLPTPPPSVRSPQGFLPQAPQNNPSTPKFPTPNPPKPTRFIPAAERAKKMAKGLCFLCDQPYERRHKCNSSGKQLFLVEVL